MHPIMTYLLTFLHTFHICLQHKMHRWRGDRPPAVHFMLQTNRKGVQKKLTSISKLYASPQLQWSSGKGLKIRLQILQMASGSSTKKTARSEIGRAGEQLLIFCIGWMFE